MRNVQVLPGRLVNVHRPSAFVLPGNYIAPTAESWVLFVLAGLCSALAWVGIVGGYRRAPPVVLAPFEYTAIPFAVIWGILIWNEWPDALSWAGMGLILAGGLYTVYRERQREVEVMSGAPMPASASASQPAEDEAR